MAEQTTPNTPPSDEIDLGQLLVMIRKGLNKVFKGVLHIFLYLKKRAIVLAVLAVLGLALGYLLNNLVDKKLKSEVIVMPNFDSKDYLYGVVEEIQSNVKNKDTVFFKNLNIDINELRSFDIRIEPIEEEEMDSEKTIEKNNYLEILNNYKDNDFVLDVIKSEILKKTVLTHRITFIHKNPKKGEEFAQKLMAYINATPYFNELKKVYADNSVTKIEKNGALIKQIDDLITNYTQQLAESGKDSSADGMILFDKERSLNVTGLISLKSRLIKEIEQKRIEIVEQKEAIKIINFGKTQVVKEQFLNKSLIFIPGILWGGFFVWSLISFLNKKSKELL